MAPILSKEQLIDLYRAGKIETHEVEFHYGQEILHEIKEVLLTECYGAHYA